MYYVIMFWVGLFGWVSGWMIFDGYTPESGLNHFIETIAVILMFVGAIGQLVISAAKTVAQNIKQHQKVEIAVDMERYHQARKAEEAAYGLTEEELKIRQSAAKYRSAMSAAKYRSAMVETGAQEI